MVAGVDGSIGLLNEPPRSRHTPTELGSASQASKNGVAGSFGDANDVGESFRIATFVLRLCRR